MAIQTTPDVGKAMTLLSSNGAREPVDAFCLAPWVHLHVSSLGAITPCCEIQEPIGDVRDDDPFDLWRGSRMGAFRRALLEGWPPDACIKCREREEVGHPSLRADFQRRFHRHRDRVARTNADGGLPNFAPVSLDIRFSNVCNFRCRTCWHESSSRWHADALELGYEVGPVALICNGLDVDRFVARLESTLPTLEEVYFAGGEPLLMDEHYRLLELLDRKGCHRVALRYNTNLSILSYKSSEVLSLWRRFPTVEVHASVDETGPRGELIRNGMRWEDFVRNARRVREECPHVRFCIHTVVSVFNILHLADLQRSLIEERLMDWENVSLGILQVPRAYSIRILPRHLKRRAARRLAVHRDWLADHARRCGGGEEVVERQVRAVEGVVQFMMARDWAYLIPKFTKISRRLDALRGERTEAVLPELAPLFRWSGCYRLLRPLLRRRAH